MIGAKPGTKDGIHHSHTEKQKSQKISHMLLNQIRDATPNHKGSAGQAGVPPSDLGFGMIKDMLDLGGKSK